MPIDRALRTVLGRLLVPRGAPWRIASLTAACLLSALSATACSPAAGPGTEGTGSPEKGLAAASPETGLELFRKGDLQGAEPHLAGALKQAPGDRRLLEALGSIYARTDRFKQADESFRAALRIDPASLGARLGLAAVCIDTGRYDEARALLAEAERREPGHLTARLKGALLDVRLGRVAEGESGARAVVAAQPGNAEAHYVLGLALEGRGKTAEAVVEMRRAQEISPGHPGALSHLVTLTTRLGQAAEAERWRLAQQRVLSRLHVEERVRDNRIKGVEAFNREDYPAALAEFLTIAREDPGDPQVHLHLGSTLLALGRPDEARAALERCLALDPRNERGLAEMGRLHALANRLDQAIAFLEKAVAINPEFAEPHYYLAGIYMARGESERYRAEMTIFESLRGRSEGSALDVQPERAP